MNIIKKRRKRTMREFLTPEMKISKFDVADIVCESEPLNDTVEIPGKGDDVLPDSVTPSTGISAFE